MVELAAIGQRGPGAKQACKEAWGWLHANGLVVNNLGRQHEADAFVITRLGRDVVHRHDLGVVRARQRLAIDLHPEIADKVRPQYLLGDYEMAAFAALRAVEVRVRRLIGAPDSDLGVKLMEKAFGEDGSYWDESRDRGEQVGRINLFKGAIGYLKNPTSHREAFYDNDPAQAAEVIMLADLLLRIVDRIEAEPRA
jgi:uncharacterized protein (TIGR02391 family)